MGHGAETECRGRGRRAGDRCPNPLKSAVSAEPAVAGADEQQASAGVRIGTFPSAGFVGGRREKS